MKKPLLGLTLTELKEVATSNGLPAFTAKQIANWLYIKHVKNIDEMTNLSLKGRELLASQYEVGRKEAVWSVESVDGTKKYLFDTTHGKIEAVFIPEEDRGTLCVSCQVGCKMNCLFCMTGKQGWNGNLTSNEIINQILSIPESEKLSNIVFMGMGEPFDNTLEVLRACDILTSDWGMAWSGRRITVSTIGLIPGMKQFLERSDCHLAVSLHSPFADERLKLMPTEKAFPISKVIDTLRKYDWNGQRRVSFEYIVFEGINDMQRHASELVRMLKGLNCRVNLIKFHAINIEGIELKSPNQEKMIWLRDYLSSNGIICTIRRSRGEDIMAACGLLSSNYKG
ncbi:MAG: 23S rRNA (adenine(2503)-C(2))-methyltransferase RlmN [bacterium]